MPVELIDLGRSADVPGAEARAAAILARGGLVVLPTETVYGVAGSASSAAALDRLWTIKGASRRAALAWHLPSSGALASVLWPEGEAGATPMHRRAVHRLTPGPVTIQAPMSEDRLGAVRARARVPQGVFDDGAHLLARVPGPEVTRRVIEQAGVPIVLAAVGEASLATSASLAEGALPPASAVEVILDAGPTAYNKQSTLVRLDPSGACVVVREGAIDERTIRKRLVRRLLFVCTGNTCRSPMAAAIARRLLADAHDGVESVVRSAGVGAGFGMQMTPEAAETLVAMGVDPGRHSSVPLSREMIHEAEAIFVMTRGHAEAVRRMDPDSAGRLLMLDPSGEDIPDPIGSPRAVYDETAKELRRAIEARLKGIP